MIKIFQTEHMEMKYFFITHVKQRHKLGPVPTYLHILSICNLKFCSVNFAKFCKFCKFAGRKCCVNTKNWRSWIFNNNSNLGQKGPKIS